MKLSSTPQLAHHHIYQSLVQGAVDETQRSLAGRKFVDGEIVLKMRDSAKLSTQYGLQQVDTFTLQSKNEPPILRARLPEGVSVAEALTVLRADPSVAYAEPNAILHLPEVVSGPGPEESSTAVVLPDDYNVPNDLDRRLWGLQNTGRRNGKAGADINTVEAWKTVIGSRDSGPLIAVIDTGIDYKHSDLAANMWVNSGEIPGDGIDNDGNGVIDDVHGYNAYADNGDPMDDHAHGSHVAGTIAAVGNNGHGLVGVNWEARLMAVKIFNKNGDTSLDAILRGLDYAAKMGADITNNSWGDAEPSEALKDAFARMDGTVHFAAAGNNRNNNDYRNYYPSGYDLPNLVSVAASDRRDALPSFSNHGEKTVHVAAPGEEILSTVPGDGYAVYSGTSMAAPHAAGVAGLLLTEHPALTPQQVKDRLIYNSDYVPALSRASVSRGRLNAASTLETDTTGPSPAPEFRVEQANSKGVTLRWLNSGDDGLQGRASDVELYFSEHPITAENLNQAERLNTLRPSDSGEETVYHFPTQHAATDRKFYFANRFVDNVGNRSELVRAEASVPKVTEVFASAFGPDDGFTANGAWARIQDPERGWVWTDSPDGNSRNNDRSAVTSPPINLGGMAQCRLSLDARHDLWQRDRAVVEASADGENWTDLGSYHARQTQWSTRHFDLSAFDGKTIQVRVRMETDLRHSKDGITIDNLTIVGDRVINETSKETAI